MKKIQITIPKPCHENWDAMTPGVQGRFCSSCQKTVVDFSIMSDRQIAEHLRKSTGPTCGRFHADQLGRELIVPKKNMPWAQYLFKATWPAFVLFLKSCTDRQSTVGEMVVKARPKQTVTRAQIATMGLPLMEITPVDTTKPVVEEPLSQSTTEVKVGVIATLPPAIIGDTIINSIEPLGEEIVVEPVKESCRPLDTVIITSQQNFLMGDLIAGGISVVTTKTSKEDEVERAVEPELVVKAYPNPVRVGSELTLELPSVQAVQQIRLVSASGASVPLVQNHLPESNRFKVPVPPNLAAGTYFLQVITDNQKARTIKIIILK